jgi:GGDEF domain-containing protein
MGAADESPTERREREIVSAATTHPGPLTLVCVNLNNFKAWNAVLGHERGDVALRAVEDSLRRLGTTWRTGGDEFVVLVGGTRAAASARVLPFTWLHHMKIGACDAWELHFSDGRPTRFVPSRYFELECTPRCGLAEVHTDVLAALAEARRLCEQAAIDPSTHEEGFAPIRRSWTVQRSLAARGCPDCGWAKPELVDADLGWSRETCPACGIGYERFEKQVVLGQVADASYM